jgi:hypothetical protein
MLRRRRPLLRAAAVGGAAYYAGQRANARGQAEVEQNERLEELEAQQASPGLPAYPPPPSTSGGLTAQLQELASLRDKGVLTEAEFAAAKAQLLGSAGAGSP